MSRIRSFAGLALVISALVFVAGCEPSDVPIVKIKVNADLSGELLGNSVALANDRKDDLGGSGLDWKEAATITMRRASFANLDSEVEVAGIRLSRDDSKASGLHRLLVTIPLGDAAWTRSFMPTSGRDQLRRTLDPADADKDFGKIISIEIELPEVCRTTTLVREQRGFSASMSGKVAKLSITLADARQALGEVQWCLSWVSKD